MKLLNIRPARDNIHKYVVVLDLGEGKTKTVRFGQAGASDFLKSGDKARRQRYLDRHRAREDWNDPTTAGFWSARLLWGETQSFAQNLSQIKKQFDL